MRKQMNGAVADSMFYYGAKYGLNYGVSLPTVREIAQAEGCDHALAKYLFRQQVRELKLAALHIADPAFIDTAEAEFWMAGITCSELAEEAAFAMLNKSPQLNEIYEQWITGENEYATYAVIMAASRSEAISDKMLHSLSDATGRYPDSRPIAQGAVALLAAAYLNPSLQTLVKDIVDSAEGSATADYIRDEMGWRMEF